MNGWLWLTPVIAAAGGWLAGKIVKKTMLGSLPRLLGEFASSLETAAQFPALSALPAGSGSHYEQIKPFIEEQAEAFFRYRLTAAMPMLAMLIGDKTILQMKTVLMKELEELFPIVIEKYLRITEAATGTPAPLPNSHWQETARVLARPFRRLPTWGLLAGLAIGVLQLIYLAIIL